MDDFYKLQIGMSYQQTQKIFGCSGEHRLVAGENEHRQLLEAKIQFLDVGMDRQQDGALLLHLHCLRLDIKIVGGRQNALRDVERCRERDLDVA